MDRRIELNPGELFLVADRTILVDEFESVLTELSQLGGDESRIAYLLTFQGKINDAKNEHDSVTIALSPRAAWQLAGQILSGLKLLVETQTNEQTP